MPTKQEILHVAMKILHAATKNQHSETNIFFNFKKRSVVARVWGEGRKG